MSHQNFQGCITACSECAVECAHCASECLKEQNIKTLTRCIRLDLDCIVICQLAIKAMAGESEFTKQICKLCAEVCNACANECEKHSHMEHCKKCAEKCRKCAMECDRIGKE